LVFNLARPAADLEQPRALESQRSGAFLFAWKDWLGIQQDIDLGAVNLGHDITMIIKALMRLTTCWLEGASIAGAELAAVLVAVWEACGRVLQCQNARGSGNPASANQPRPDSRGHEVSACHAGINGPVR